MIGARDLISANFMALVGTDRFEGKTSAGQDISLSRQGHQSERAIRTFMISLVPP